MKETSRKIFFWSLLILFILAASLVVPYAMGYRFSFERGIFIYTGSISLKATPQDISVVLDGKPAPKGKLNLINNSYHLGGLNPGEHQVEIGAPGFRPWRKKAGISSGISTEFWNILLVREEYPRTRFETPDISGFFLDSQKNLVAFVENNPEVLRVNVLDIGNSLIENVFNSEDYRFTSDKDENIEWSPELFKIIVPAEDKAGRNYLIVDTKTKAFSDLRSFTGLSDLGQVRWDPRDRRYVYFLSGAELFRQNINEANDRTIVASGAASFDFVGRKIFFLSLSDGLAYSTEPGSDAAPDPITDNRPGETELSSFRITTYDERRIVLRNPEGDLYVFNDGEKERYFRKLSDQARGVQFSNDGKKLLFWSDWEIGSYFLRDWEVQPVRLENEVKEITRFAENISSVQWTRDYEHVVFLAGKTLKVIEIDHRDNKNLTDIATLASDRSKAVADFSDDLLYFTDRDPDGKIYLFSIDFPEAETLF